MKKSIWQFRRYMYCFLQSITLFQLTLSHMQFNANENKGVRVQFIQVPHFVCKIKYAIYSDMSLYILQWGFSG